MRHDPTSAIEFRRAAVRMVAAAEYFKAAGDLPSWARADLNAWNDDDDDAAASRARAAPQRPR